MTDTLYSVKAVAACLGIRQHGILAMIKNGALRAVDVSVAQGGKPRWRITDEDLKTFIDARTFQPAQRRRRRKAVETLKKYF